ncbi:MAG: hypothetical protein AAGG51_07290 [Cyanobacteria bacterium P01_G01_bin.54]
MIDFFVVFQTIGNMSLIKKLGFVLGLVILLVLFDGSFSISEAKALPGIPFYATNCHTEAIDNVNIEICDTNTQSLGLSRSVFWNASRSTDEACSTAAKPDGDFTVKCNKPDAGFVLDGNNEATRWSFDLSHLEVASSWEDDTWEAVELSLTLIPGNQCNYNDELVLADTQEDDKPAFHIPQDSPDGPCTPPEQSSRVWDLPWNFPKNIAIPENTEKTVTLDLLDYRSEPELKALIRNNDGNLNMQYRDDASIVSATLTIKIATSS